MPGFLINNYEKEVVLKDPDVNSYVMDKCQYKSWIVQRNTLDKFFLDKTLYQNEEYIVLLEGVLLNKMDLFQKYHSEDVASLAISMYHQIGVKFFKEFRGSFSGAFYSKKKDEWLIFTNHYGDNAVYYYFQQDKFIIGSQLNYIADGLKKNEICYTLNEHAVHTMLTYGYMPDDRTYLNEVKRLYPGHYIRISKGNLELCQYFKISQNVYDLKHASKDEIIDGLDQRFREAIRLEYEKDLEYGYRHFANLSGGLDSRMNLWVAQDMGYSDILCVTFGQSNCMDEKVAKEIAEELGLEILVWPLDSAKHLFRIDDYIAMNKGAAHYSGIGAQIEILQTINTNIFGLMHSGQIGDVVIGTFISNVNEMKDMTIGGTYSEKLITKEEVDGTALKFENREQYLMFTRAFMGCLSSHFFIRNYTEVASPFLNVDLFEYCMSIPLELRINHYIYKKWILSKYPKAADFIWEKIGQKITEKPIKSYLPKVKLAIKYPKLVLRKLGFHVQLNFKLTEGMNPFDLWWKKNNAFRNLYDNYFDQSINNPIFSDEIKEQLTKLYNEGSALEKAQVITALGTVNFFFSKK
ncbi:MAG: hypothetical protein HFJ09_01555 [Lachnospiraceae bacterium]|nr:hypothetical protein [Lachnospiraceae bacterium]